MIENGANRNKNSLPFFIGEIIATKTAIIEAQAIRK
jgi:hypothetical protein